MIPFKSVLLASSTKSEIPDPIPIVFGDIIASIDNMLVKQDGNILSLSTDMGITFNHELDISEVEIIKCIYVFNDGSLLLANNQKCFYSEDWQTLNESSIYGIDGDPWVRVSPSDNFSSYRKAQVRQIIEGIEVFCWGNYSLTNGIIYAWYTIDNGKTIKCAYQFGVTIPVNKTQPLVCRHIHNIDFNTADKSFWLQTGDEPTERDSHLIKGLYDVSSDSWLWHWIGSGNSFKLCHCLFLDNYIYMAWDISFGGVKRVKYIDIADETKHEVIFRTPNDCISIILGERGDMLVLISWYGGDENPRNFWYSPDRVNFYKIEGVVPPEYQNNKQTIYHGVWHPNDEGKILACIRDLSQPASTWTMIPSVWIDDMVKNAGFNDAFKPL